MDGRRVLEVDVAHAVGEPGKNDQRLVGIYKRLNPGLSINRNCLLAQYNGSIKIIRSHALAQPMS